MPVSTVVRELGRQLIVVIGKTGNLMNVWPEEETFKLLALDAPIPQLLGRRAITEKLREENNEIKHDNRYIKY